MLLSLCIRGIPHNGPVAGKQLAIGECRSDIEQVDAGASVDGDDGGQIDA